MIDLFCGRFGWSKAFVQEGHRAIGFDICHDPAIHGPIPKHCELVLQDVLTLHGRQFRDAACIVASPPCQEFSYMAMPWKRAKAKAATIRADTSGAALADLTRLFDACFRIQREASEAAGRHIPMVVENVKGAQPWVGRAQANYGSFYLWGDVRSVGGRIIAAHQVRFGAQGVRAMRGQKFNPDGTEHGQGSWFKVANSKNRGSRKNVGGSWFNIGSPGQRETGCNPVHELAGRKVPGMNFHDHEKTGAPGRSFQSAAVDVSGVKQPGLSGAAWFDRSASEHGSGSSARKAASAKIAEIPFDLAQHIARVFKPSKDAVA